MMTNSVNFCEDIHLLNHVGVGSNVITVLLFCSLQRTLRAGKLNEKILKLFIATGKEEILSLIGAFNIQCVLTPVLPTSKCF